MRTFEVHLEAPPGLREMERAVTAVCREIGLCVGMPRSLASYPGSLHWHLKRQNERGTLEISYVPEPTRLWLAVHANREAAWIDEEMARLPLLLRRALNQATPDEAT